MKLEEKVAQHYTRADLEGTILRALAAAGKDIEHLTIDDLAPVDEFHTGGRPATVAFATALGVSPGTHILDLGCGLGGPARYMAKALDCPVVGIDLTAAFITTAIALTRRVGLDGRVTFRQGSVLDLPFEDKSVEAATLIHVGMNIADKTRLFAEVRRVLTPGGKFGIYDVMRVGAGELSYPLPWSRSPSTSFVETPSGYRTLLASSRFDVESETSRADLAIKVFERQMPKPDGGTPAPGLATILGDDFAELRANIVTDLKRGVLAPIELICRAA